MAEAFTKIVIPPGTIDNTRSCVIQVPENMQGTSFYVARGQGQRRPYESSASMGSADISNLLSPERVAVGPSRQRDVSYDASYGSADISQLLSPERGATRPARRVATAGPSIPRRRYDSSASVGSADISQLMSPEGGARPPRRGMPVDRSIREADSLRYADMASERSYVLSPTAERKTRYPRRALRRAQRAGDYREPGMFMPPPLKASTPTWGPRHDETFDDSIFSYWEPEYDQPPEMRDPAFIRDITTPEFGGHRHLSSFEGERERIKSPARKRPKCWEKPTQEDLQLAVVQMEPPTESESAEKKMQVMNEMENIETGMLNNDLRDFQSSRRKLVMNLQNIVSAIPELGRDIKEGWHKISKPTYYYDVAKIEKERIGHNRRIQ